MLFGTEHAIVKSPHGWVNLHFSGLPAWRGAAPVQRSIWAGDEVTGATTFRIVRELDAADYIAPEADEDGVDDEAEDAVS